MKLKEQSSLNISFWSKIKDHYKWGWPFKEYKQRCMAHQRQTSIWFNLKKACKPEGRNHWFWSCHDGGQPHPKPLTLVTLVTFWSNSNVQETSITIWSFSLKQQHVWKGVVERQRLMEHTRAMHHRGVETGILCGGDCGWWAYECYLQTPICNADLKTQWLQISEKVGLNGILIF